MNYGDDREAHLESMGEVPDEAQKVDDAIYDMLSVLAGIDTHDVNLRDSIQAYVAVYVMLGEIGVTP
jgi:hypothetical protein